MQLEPLFQTPYSKTTGIQTPEGGLAYVIQLSHIIIMQSQGPKTLQITRCSFVSLGEIFFEKGISEVDTIIAPIL